ncbi:MAG: 30S ribosomal protein S6--L-glutamate ligase [Bradymonadales bacterium]|nr:MAG: 30S ribosomal protein S6--L-glutamate ligase [Bradymonadales bacterium]
MKICILSRRPSLYSTQRLVESARERGHDVIVVDPLKCHMNITSSKPAVHFGDQILDDIDAVIPRIGASITFYGTAVLRQFEMMGVFCVNESVAITRSRDKLRALQIFSRKGIGMPISSFAHSTKMTKDLIKMVGGAPLVIKLLEGTQGRGVVLAETAKAAESVIDAFRGMDAHFLVQAFVKESSGEDIRCLVIGDKCVAAMMRTAKEGEFRSNLHLGATARPVKITPTERKEAVRAARALGLNVAGVDLMRGKSGPLVIEVNSSPGLKGIENCTHKNVAGMIVEFIEKNLENSSNRTRGKG